MVFGEAVSGNYFSTIGVSPALGRGIEPEDDRPGATAVAVLNHATWETRFGSDPPCSARAFGSTAASSRSWAWLRRASTA